MTDEQAERLEQKIDKIIDALPTIDALGAVLVRRSVAIDRAGLSKNVFNDRPAFEETGQRKTYIEIGEIGTVKRRKRNKNESR